MKAFLEEFQHLKIQLEDIKSATGNFDNNNIIGKGGFGNVYKGILSHLQGETMVAFKHLDSKYGQGDPEFLKEILILSRYTHENLISLLGYCDEDDEKILVYEYASHGSLDHHLSSTSLTWRQRLKICLGAARGLCYLHDPKGTHQRVIHRDVKSSNFLIDENWNAKVSDMGLSKFGPANQQHTFLVTNVVGTFGYVDPMYMNTSVLTKESDVFSFGVVLFEALCGRLCYEYKNGHLQSLVPTWKKSYKQKILDEIVFQDLKQQMYPSSLETFSDIAYQCLQKSREKRPSMSHVVEKLEIALRLQEIFEEVERPTDYERMIITAVPPLVYTSKEELLILLSKGLFVNNGKTWFLLDKNGQHCEMISAAECLIPIDYASAENGIKKSRFPGGHTIHFCSKFKIHVKTNFLSPHMKYKVNLVFGLGNIYREYLGLDYILAGDTKSWTSYFAEKRDDGCLIVELYRFTSDSRNIDLEILFKCRIPLAVEGIEFQPLLEQMEEHKVLKDEEVDIQNISHLDTTYWKQKLPTDYYEITKWSKDRLLWITKKELYFILCKGFSVNNGEGWFSLDKNGKKCHKLSARMILQTSEWDWGSSLESRFKEVAFDPPGSFWIYCRSQMLSPETSYATYLVYKLQEIHSGFEPPVRVNLRTDRDHSWKIHLLLHQTPIIRQKVYHNIQNPILNRPKGKGLPQERSDGWVEVQIWEFQTSTTSKEIKEDLQLTLPGNKSLKGLIVQGIEFKPL